MRRAAFLDRDGVLNRPILRCGCVGSPRRFEEFELFDNAARCVGRLQASGLLVIVVTNQPDVARGMLDPEELDHMHWWMKETTALDAIYTCPHDDRDACFCRKPKPGLLLRAAREWDITLGASYMVGDSWKDIEAGNAAGCQTFLVKPQFTKTREIREIKSSFDVQDLNAAVEMIAVHFRHGYKTTSDR